MMWIVRQEMKNGFIRMLCFSILIAAISVPVFCGSSHAARMRQMTFASPDEAFAVLLAVVKSGDAKQLAAIFGPGGKYIFPADESENAQMQESFAMAYDKKNRLEQIGKEKVILHVGENDWPWPVPVVKAGKRWRFDTGAGIKEIAARRIGKNEISAIQVCLAYVDSQLEYAREHNIGGISEYAQKLASDPGMKNGLCWEAKDGEQPSLLGPLLVSACKTELKGLTQQGMEPAPYHGYYYKILKSQGNAAPGGAYNYVMDGKMIGGFALVAYPAAYGATGITTFIVSKDGIVYQKDLGKNTEKIAEAMELYNPDATWEKVD